MKQAYYCTRSWSGSSEDNVIVMSSLFVTVISEDYKEYAVMGTRMIIPCTRGGIAPTLTSLLEEKSLSRHMQERSINFIVLFQRFSFTFFQIASHTFRFIGVILPVTNQATLLPPSQAHLYEIYLWGTKMNYQLIVV